MDDPKNTFQQQILPSPRLHLRSLKIVLDAAECVSARHADWKAAAWVQEKGWPREYAPFERQPVPVESQPPKPVPNLSHMVKFTLDGHPEIDLGEVIHARCVIAAYERRWRLPGRLCRPLPLKRSQTPTADCSTTIRMLWTETVNRNQLCENSALEWLCCMFSSRAQCPRGARSH